MAAGTGSDPVESTREAAGQLVRAVEQVQSTHGDTLGVRRLRSDVRRIFDDLDELGPPMPGHLSAAPPMLEPIPDEGHDASPWADDEREGPGAPDRRAP